LCSYSNRLLADYLRILMYALSLVDKVLKCNVPFLSIFRLSRFPGNTKRYQVDASRFYLIEPPPKTREEVINTLHMCVAYEHPCFDRHHSTLIDSLTSELRRVKRVSGSRCFPAICYEKIYLCFLLD